MVLPKRMSFEPALKPVELEPISEINTVSMIGLMLVLLVVMIGRFPSAGYAVHAVIPPERGLIGEFLPEIIDLDIDFDGTILWNDTIVPNTDKLDQYFRRAWEKQPQPVVRLRPNRLATYESVVKVLSSAQRSHILRVGVVSTERLPD